MAKFTIATAKRLLAKAFPDIEFTYGRSGRGRDAGPCVSWVGGPTPDVIRAAAGAPAYHRYGFAPYHFVRQPTPEEYEEMRRQWDEERRAAVAAEPARRAAAKAAGIEKRKATHAAKCARLAVLYGAFPGVDFDITAEGVFWTDGPTEGEVAGITGEHGVWEGWYKRRRTPESLAREMAEKAAKVHTGRLAKRLAASKVRALRVAKGVERRRVAMLPHLPRLERNPDQFLLPMIFPVWERPPVFVAFGVSGVA